MLEAHACIEHCDDSHVVADGDVPRLFGARGGGLDALEVPLIREQRVAGQCVRPAVPIGDRVFDVRIRRQPFEQRFHVIGTECAIELQHVRLGADLLLALQAQSRGGTQLLHARARDGGSRSGAVAPFDDDLICRRLHRCGRQMSVVLAGLAEGRRRETDEQRQCRRDSHTHSNDAMARETVARAQFTLAGPAHVPWRRTVPSALRFRVKSSLFVRTIVPAVSTASNHSQLTTVRGTP